MIKQCIKNILLNTFWMNIDLEKDEEQLQGSSLSDKHSTNLKWCTTKTV